MTTVARIAPTKEEAARPLTAEPALVWDHSTNKTRVVKRWLSPVRFTKSPIENMWRAEREAELG